jgi:hypothetical protein
MGSGEAEVDSHSKNAAAMPMKLHGSVPPEIPEQYELLYDY